MIAGENMATKIPIDTQKLSVNVLRRVDGMRRDRKHCDFLIKVGSEEIPAHRNILSANSDYFDAMFSHPMEENKSGVVEMMGVNPECAIICVDHMYGKEVYILPEMYEPLMYVANLLLLHTLRDAIATLLEANLDPKIFATTKKIADMYGCKSLEEKCNKFAEENFGLIIREENFGDFDKSFIRKMIMSRNVKLSEKLKLGALLKWIKYDSDRSKLLEDLMGIIDLSKVSVGCGFLRNVAQNEPLICENLRLYKMISTSVFNSAKIVSESILSETDADEAPSAVAIFDRNSGHIYHWNPRDNIWKRMQEMNDEMKSGYFSAVELGGYLYVLLKSKSFYRIKYSDKSARWEKMPNMLLSHGECPPAVILDGHVYVIGGHNSCSTSSAEKYDPVQNTWTWVSIKGKNQASRFSEVVASQGFIHSFGGYVGWKYVKQHEKFDPTVQTWSEMLPMKEEKGYAAAATLGGKIYILGGLDSDGKDVRTVEVFDLNVDQWATLNPMSVGRISFRALVVDGSIYAVGGYNSPDSIEKYDVEKNEWTIVEMPRDMKLNIVESAKIKLSD